MFKQMVVLSSLLAGIGSAGMAMYLQANPLALSHGNRVNLDTYLYSAKTEVAPKAETTPLRAVETSPAEAETADMVMLPEVVVSRPRSAQSYAAPRSVGMSIDPALQMRALPGALGAPSTLDGVREGTPAAAPRELQPCSNFREIGPMHVDDGVPSGVRGVRDLC